MHHWLSQAWHSNSQPCVTLFLLNTINNRTFLHACYCALVYCTVLHCTIVMYCTVLCSSILHCITLYYCTVMKEVTQVSSSTHLKYLVNNINISGGQTSLEQPLPMSLPPLIPAQFSGGGEGGYHGQPRPHSPDISPQTPAGTGGHTMIVIKD